MSFNKLTDAEAERLALLSEEAGEIVQAVGKILRHGYESKHPRGGPTNRQLLQKEILDLYAVVKMMSIENEDIDEINQRVVSEILVKKYEFTHHQGEMK